MNLELNPKHLIEHTSHFLYRYHVVLFVIIVIGSLAVATFLLNLAMSPQPPAGNNSATSTKLDTDTMKEIDALRTESTPLVLPTDKRTNPFN